MSVYRRALRGAEAGAIAAGATELSFFVLDLIRLQPLATPVTLSGAAPGPGGNLLDLTSVSGILAGLWTSYQVVYLTFVHFLAFGLVGILASFLFDWSRVGGVGRFVVVAAFCTIAFYGTAAWSSSIVALESVGGALVMGMNIVAALILVGTLRFASMSDTEDGDAA